MVNLVITLACLFFVLASVSRNNILVFVFAASIIVLTQISASGREFRYSRGQIGLLVLGTLAALVVSGNFLLDAIEGMLMIGAQRFGNIEEEPRLVMYADALRQINLIHCWV